ncbi:hypothetical protein [Fructilactobacillus sanfranciscensis]|uniref:hypothetical protein n=1 Tax=Fructilactobacillus sanfranciscensis TaxID=1625 RepID=UPI001EE1E561|nr:hypothetical protein [Fructilactobacillus sanfranciscensis]
MLLGTSKTLKTETNASGWSVGAAYQPRVAKVNSDTTYTARAWISPASHDMNTQIVWKDSSGNLHYGGGNAISAGTSGYSTWTGTIPAGSTIQYVTVVFTEQQQTASTVTYGEVKLEKGTVAHDWSPAPEDLENADSDNKPTDAKD